MHRGDRRRQGEGEGKGRGKEQTSSPITAKNSLSLCAAAAAADIVRVGDATCEVAVQVRAEAGVQLGRPTVVVGTALVELIDGGRTGLSRQRS